MKHMHCPDVEGYDAEALGLAGSVKTIIRGPVRQFRMARNRPGRLYA